MTFELPLAILLWIKIIVAVVFLLILAVLAICAIYYTKKENELNKEYQKNVEEYVTPYKEELDKSTYFLIARHDETGNLILHKMDGNDKWKSVNKEELVKILEEGIDENILKKVPQKFS